MQATCLRRTLLLSLLVWVVPLCAQNREHSYFPGPSYYGTGTWNADSLGNHRAVIKVTEKADAVVEHIPWRRRDRNPEQKGIYVFDASSGKRILNVVCLNINREFGDVVFQPMTVPGDYYVYISSTGPREQTIPKAITFPWNRPQIPLG